MDECKALLEAMLNELKSITLQLQKINEKLGGS